MSLIPAMNLTVAWGDCLETPQYEGWSERSAKWGETCLTSLATGKTDLWWKCCVEVRQNGSRRGEDGSLPPPRCLCLGLDCLKTRSPWPFKNLWLTSLDFSSALEGVAKWPGCCKSQDTRGLPIQVPAVMSNVPCELKKLRTIFHAWVVSPLVSGAQYEKKVWSEIAELSNKIGFSNQSKWVGIL